MRKEILEALKQLQQGNIPSPKEGICGNIDALVGRYVNKNIFQYFDSWKHFSGSYAYPVPDPINGEYSDTIYEKRAEENTMWVGAYGALRMDLVNHLIKELKNEEANNL